MSKVDIEFGPPGASGVSNIMGIGEAADELDIATAKAKASNWLSATNTEEALDKAGKLSLGALALGVLTGSATMRNIGLGGAAVAYGAKYLVKP